MKSSYITNFYTQIATSRLKSILLIALLVSTAFSSTVSGQANTLASQGEPTETFDHEMDYLIDRNGTMSFDSVRNSVNAELDLKPSDEKIYGKWKPVLEGNIIGGFTDAIYWVKFTAHNRAKSEKSAVLEVDYAILDLIELYSPNASTEENTKTEYSKTLAGDLYPFHDRPIEYRNVAFPLTLPALSTQTFYVRFQTESSMYISLNFWPENSFSESIEGQLLVFGFLYGIALLACIYSLINALFMRERMYIFIAIGILGSLSYSLSINGFGFQYLWPNGLWLQSVMVPFCLNIGYAFLLLYSREFLALKVTSPKSDKVILAFVVCCFTLSFASLFMNYGLVIRVSTIFAIIMAFAAFWAGAISSFSGNKATIYFLIGWMVLIIGMVTFALKSLGIIPSNLLTVWGIEFGFAGIAIFLTLAQSDLFFKTQRKHEAEQNLSINAIKSAERKYRSLFENAIEGIFQMDMHGNLININKAFASIIGYEDVNQLLAQSQPAFSLNCLDAAEKDKFKLLIETETSATSFETFITTPTGKIRWIIISIQKIKNKYDVASRYEGALADITESKKRQNAEKQQRMAEASTEAKSLFLANMSHEIRTPMNAIIGFTDIALNQNKDQKLSSFLQKIRTASSNLLGIINDILDFSKIEAGKLEIEQTPFSLKEVLDNMSNMVSANIEAKKLKLKFNIDNDIPDKLIGDPLRIGQVLLNLTNNAVKFTNKGKVTVDLELVSLNKRDSSIRISGQIIDTGIGIKPEKLKTLFSSFTQADDSTTRQFGGTGLGLSISKQLVEMMGGELTAESIENQGSTFKFKLSCKIQDRRKRNNPHFKDQQRPMNILFVDDQAESRELIENALTSLNHKVTSVCSSEEAIEALLEKQKDSMHYDVLISDWLMPEEDGISCCERVKQHPEIINPRLILVTGYDQDGARQKAKDVGIDAYMLKPVSARDLSNILQKVFQDRRDDYNQKKSKAAYDSFSFDGLKVLLVEDVVMNQELATEILSKKGIITSLANNGQEAVEAIRANKFDVVLMDMQMPIMDGCQATETIRKFNQQLPIIAMTANAMASDKEKCLASGMNGYITKPINPDELFNTIAHWTKQTTQDTNATEPNNNKNTPKNRPTNPVVIERAPDQAKIATEQQKTLPERVPGIEIQEGLKRCQGNINLYVKFFKDFKQRYSDSTIAFNELIANEDYTGIAALAHNLKGIAANLAAKPLSKCAEELEKASSMTTPALEKSLREFDQALLLFLDSIEIIINDFMTESSPAETDESSTSTAISNEDTGALLELITQLIDLIGKQELDAQDFAVDLKTRWPNREQTVDFESLISALDDFDFKSAQDKAAMIKHSL
jgi:PAS domain S-box-containing protein